MDHKSFSRKILLWYGHNKRDLPWRKTGDPYKIWISEIMLQQTTVPAVIPYYEKWFVLFPDIMTLNKAPLQTVLKAWQGLGYYQRAKNMKAAASIIMDKHGGQIPNSYDELIGLPGFGPYTTAAVLSIAYDLPYPVLDANVRRVAMRLKGLKKEASTTNDPVLSEFLKPLLPQKRMGTFNQALMELGSLICRSHNPSCLSCPVADFCMAYQKGEQEVIPTPQKRKYKKIEAVIGIISEDGRFLIQQRPPMGLLADLWEFPGGKKEEGESLEQALKREIKEELNTDIQDIRFLTRVHHSYTQFQVTLHAFECRLQKELQIKGKNMRWITLKGLRRFPFPSGSVKIVKFLEKQRSQQDRRISREKEGL